MSINDNVLSEIGFTSKTVGVWWGWLVNGPVVVWWVLDWVSNLEEGSGVESGGGIGGDVTLAEGSGVSSVVGVLLGNLNFIWADEHFHVELGISDGVLEGNWVDVNWDSLGESSLLLLLLEKGNLIWADEDLHVELGFSHGILKGDWVDVNWDTGLLSESDSDWRWLINDQVLEVSSGDVLTAEGEHTVFIGLLSESDSDWRWLINNEVLEVSSGDVLTTEGEHTVLVGFLGECDSDWGWLVLSLIHISEPTRPY